MSFGGTPDTFFFSSNNMQSPGLLTYDRTVLHVCSALPLSSKSSSTQELRRDIMETHLHVYFNVFLNNTTKSRGILSYLTWPSHPAHAVRYIDTNISAAVAYLPRWFFPNVLFFRGGWKNKNVFLPAANFWQSATICMWTVKDHLETPSWLWVRLYDVTPSFVGGRNKSDNRRLSESSKSNVRWFKMQWVHDNSEQQINAEHEVCIEEKTVRNSCSGDPVALQQKIKPIFFGHRNFTLMPLIETPLHAPPPVLVYVCRHTYIYIYI